QAEEAMNFYTSVFKRSKPGDIMRYGDAGPGPKGAVMSASFELDGQEFIALNGGPNPEFRFTSAISFFIKCATQDEVDELWDKLSEGGETLQCGWLRDRFGITWQVVPTVLGDMLQDKDAARSARVMRAMMQMRKLDIATLQRAYEGQ
ncbi:MAG TPA: VOC family protein, partial [Trinickia sp.]|nr:VOC family protein [Trinickia sp.]